MQTRYFCVVLDLRMWIMIWDKKFLKLIAKGVHLVKVSEYPQKLKILKAK